MTPVIDTLTFSDSFLVCDIVVDVTIDHPANTEVLIDLAHSGTTVRLKQFQYYGAATPFSVNYPTVHLPFESLERFYGNNTSDGAWDLVVRDNSNADTGTLNTWCLTLTGF